LSGSPEGNDENVNATIDTFNVTGEVFSSRFVVGSVSVASQFYRTFFYTELGRPIR
jgi:hypothetical protein